MALRRCAVEGAACLDVGTMEGLVPALLAKRSAREVVSVDFSNHSLGKLDAVRHYHGVSFEYRSVGLIYDLGKRLRGRGFDVINLSGLLYHVFSPLMALAAVRPLLKRNGLLVVSTNVTLDRDYVADFNALGRLQGDLNTFWYPSARLFDYLLRYMRLEPIDCWFLPHTEVGGVTSIEKPTGYASVVCRAIDRVDGDAWMRASAREAWEYRGLCDWRRAGRQPLSDVKYRGTAGDGGIDVAEMIATTEPVRVPVAEDDSHLLRLDARS
jgi:SAM-dependent methyltransferase